MKFIVWLSVLTELYEPIISDNLRQLGYCISAADNSGKTITKYCIGYKLEHSSKHSQEQVREDIRNIISKNKIFCHFSLITKYVYPSEYSWNGSNIDYTIFDKSDADREIDNVISQMHNLLDQKSNELRKNRFNL